MSAKNFQSMALSRPWPQRQPSRVQSAGATEFDWSYSGSNGGPVTARRHVGRDPIGRGVYDVTSITGANIVAITELAVYAGKDNEVYTTPPIVDYPGLAYSITGRSFFNVYYDTAP